MGLTKDYLAVLGVDGMTVSAMARGVAELTWSSDEVSALLDDEQFTLGEGPAVDALESGVPVSCAELAGTGRWPGFTAAALARGVHAVFAFPVLLGAVRAGVLMCHRRTAGPLDVTAATEALVLVDSLTPQLLAGPDEAQGELWSQDLHRAEVHQATGILSVRLDVSLTDALARLRAYAFSRDLPIIEVARAVVAGELRPPRDFDGS